MYDLSLFPLNTVLFPEMPVHLHIFEGRYLQMIGACIEQQQPFGVVLIRRGSEAFGPLAETYRVGCSAEITQVEKLPQGSLNIIAVGRERFRIITLDDQSQTFLIGKVEHYPLKAGSPAELTQQGRDLRPWLESYLQILAETGGVKLEVHQLPENPLALANLAATILQCPPEEKQALLEAEQAGEMLAGLLSLFRREVALQRVIQSRQAGPDPGLFSSNN